MYFSSSLLVLAAAAAPALATVYVTSPVASTSWAAGQSQTISWQDDGASPSLSEFGTAKVGIYVGSQTVQVSDPSVFLPCDCTFCGGSWIVCGGGAADKTRW